MIEKMRNLLRNGCFNIRCIGERSGLGQQLDHYVSGRRDLGLANHEKLRRYMEKLHDEIGIILNIPNKETSIMDNKDDISPVITRIQKMLKNGILTEERLGQGLDQLEGQ